MNAIPAEPRAVYAARKRRARAVGRISLYAVLCLSARLFLIPLLSMVFTSLKSMDEIRTGNLIGPPQDITFEAWRQAWDTACISVECNGLKGYFVNSMMMAVPAVVISVALGAVNGYVLTKWRFHHANVVFGLLLFGTFIPFQIVIIPMARTLRTLGLAGDVSGLIFVHVVYGVCFTTLFFRNFYVAVPDELIKAARVDGARFWTIFRRILLPISWPIIVVVVIWQFTNIWNDFLFGSAFAAGANQPITVALNNLVNTSTGTKAYNVDWAGAMIAALPTIAVYVLAGRYFLRGLLAGSVKG